MRSGLLFLIALTIVQIGRSQSDDRFNQIYPSELNSIGYNVLEVGDGYVLDGMAINDSNFWQLEFLKLDPSGDVKAANTVQVSGFNTVSGKINSLLHTTSNSLLKIGSIRTKTDGKYRPFVLKLDTNLDTLTSKIYFDLYGVFFQTACLTDKGIACSGFVQDSVTNAFRLTLTHIDSNFNLLWHKTFEPGQELNAWGWTVVSTPDGGFVVGGTKWSTSKSNPWILRTDSIGQLDWARTIEETEHTEGNATVVLTDNQRIIIGSKYPTRMSSFNKLLVKGRITKMTLSNEVLWSKAYGTPQVGDGFSTLKSYPNGDVMGLTYSQQKGDTLGWLDAWAIRISSEGDSIWESRYDVLLNRPIKNCNLYPAGLSISKDGGFVTAGYATYTDTSSTVLVGRQDMWAVKFDSNGCFDTVFSCRPVIPEDTLTGIYSGPAHDRTFIYPNPTSGTIHLGGRLPLRIDLRDGLGRLMFTIVDPARVMDISELNAGVYFGTLFYKGGDIATVKWIKQ